MQNYLSGYLSVLPLIQRKRVVELLSRNEDYRYNIISSAEFNALIEQITNEHTQATQYTPQVEELSTELYNQFFGAAYTDLNFMFNEVNLIDRAITNYRSLAFSELSNLNKEVNDLYTQIENLKQVAVGEDGLIVRTETFQGAVFEEDPTGVYANLFCDRDGTELPKASVALNNKKRALGLRTKVVTDRVHNPNGLMDAEIELLDQRGQSVSIAGRGMGNSLDGSDETYWLQIVQADDEINMQMYGIKGPGAMSKLAVTFNSPVVVSEISVTPFTIYPLEVAAILYETEIEYGVNSDTVPPTQKYIMASNELLAANPSITPLISTDNYIGSDTMVFSFPSTLIKRLILVLRQKNYRVKSNVSTEWEIEKENLWYMVSDDATEDQRFQAYLKSADGGFEVYV
jgi:hypothetical protein